jgi:hypothetical protein
MRKRRLRWVLVLAGLAVAIVLIAAVAVAKWFREDPVTLLNYQRIHKGMSQSEVRAILGPPQDSSSGVSFGIPGGRHAYADSWLDDVAYIVVDYDDDHRVDITSYGYSGRRGLYGDLVRRAKRQWHRWFPEK